MAKATLVLCAMGMIGWFYFQKKVQSELQSQVQANFDKKLADTNLDVVVGAAQFVEGHGLRLNNVRVASKPGDGNNGSQFAEIYEAFIHAPISLTSLVSGELKPRGIEIRRAKIRIRRLADGSWNVRELIDAAKSLQADAADPVPLSLTDCQLELEDTTMNPPRQTTFSEVKLQLVPVMHEGREILQLTSEFRSADFGQMRCAAYIDGSLKTWIADFESEHSRINKDLFDLLPESFRRSMGPSPSMSGLVKFSGSATGAFDLKTVPQFQISGTVSELTSDDFRLPLPITQARADFEVDNRRLTLTNAAGRLGTGEFNLNYRQVGLIQKKQWAADGQIINFDFSDNAQLARALPEYCQTFCRDFSPRGRANIQFDLAFDGQQLSRKVESQLQDMSFKFVRFPYRLDQCTGHVSLLGDHCEFAFRSLEGQQIVEIKGHAKNPGPRGTYQINLSVPGELPIDDKLLNAMKHNPKLYQVVTDFNPTGRIGGLGRIEKRVAGGSVFKSFDIRLKQCHARHTHFDYPINNIHGLIRTRNDKFDFQEIRGTNSTGIITCDGNWTTETGLDLRFSCQHVPLDDQLKFALRPELRQVWDGFRPRGTVDTLRVDLTMPPDNPQVDLVVEAQLTKSNEANGNAVSIHPTWFPYEIKQLTGTVTAGRGEIGLKNLEGRHGRSWLVCEGDGQYSEDAWSVKLTRFLVGSLKIDEELLAAMPANLSRSVRQMGFQGLLNIKGEFGFAGQNPKPKVRRAVPRGLSASMPRSSSSSLTPLSASMAWNVRLDMNQAKMKIGLPIENVFGKVQLEGQYDGQSVECRGNLDVDSLTIYGAQITKLKGPIWIDPTRTAAGEFAQTQAEANSNGNFAPVGFERRKPTSLTASMYGGIVKFDAQMSSGPAGEFYLQTTLADGDLKEFCREFAPHLSEVSGRSFAALHLAGNYNGLHSYRGGGIIRLLDAKIYELPVIVSLLKILSVRQVTRTAFDASNVEFSISGDNIDFSRIELLGDAISLLGKGKMNLDRDIDLDFYSVMGRNRLDNIPVISDIYRASSQQILWINVDGTLDNPRTNRRVLPQFNDTLRQLFEPPDPNNSASNWGRKSLPLPDNGTPNSAGEAWR